MSTEQKFKKGDRVVKIGGGLWRGLEEVVTVDRIDGERVWAKEPNSWLWAGSVEFAHTTQDNRDELEAALKLLQEYGIIVTGSQTGSTTPATFKYTLLGQKPWVGELGILNKVLPLETPQQKKLKELEQQQLAIAVQMKQLRNEL